ncbi:hypothetical protein ACO2Q3_12785 [Caulobacter sp. KR2-114]|uniref:hypothetical protein n=1 Tax=Caulobacter sp. KR2-114 TaxID=3400912 RepID=UPI003BFF5D24
MRHLPSLLLGLIALVLAVCGPLMGAAPAQASMSPAHVMAGMPDDCPMHRHAGKGGHADTALAVCACCCGQAAVEAPAPTGPSAPSVARRPMAPVAELTGGPGRSIPPALGPPRAGG